MFLGRKQIAALCVFSVLFFYWNPFRKKKTVFQEELPQALHIPHQKLNPSAPSAPSFILSSDDSADKAKLVLKKGSGPHQLGVSDDPNPVGPGMIKKSKEGYLVSDTINNRIIKFTESGTQDFQISFSDKALLQGFAENKRGELWNIRREGDEIFLDHFDAHGRKKKSVPLQTKDELFRNYVGTFRTFFSGDRLYVATSHKVMRVHADGATKIVPGIPHETRKDVFISARQDKNKQFIVDLKNENSQRIQSFYAHGKYQSLKNIFSDNQGRIHIEFEHTFESVDAITGKEIVTHSGIIESYSDEGKFLKDEMIEKSSDAEIDQDLDINEDGNLNHMALKEGSFEIFDRMI